MIFIDIFTTFFKFYIIDRVHYSSWII